MPTNRREFITTAASAAVLATTINHLTANPPDTKSRPNRIGVSSYSFFQFTRQEFRPMEKVH